MAGEVAEAAGSLVLEPGGGTGREWGRYRPLLGWE